MAPVADKYPTIRDRGRYRIQSVDFETFLERRGTDVVLRPLKKSSENQKWIFVKIKNNVYEIEPITNPNRILFAEEDTDISPSTFSLGLETRPVQGTKIGTSWTLYIADPFTDHLFIVSEELRTRRINNYLLHVDNKGNATVGPDSQVKADQNFHNLEKGEDHLWRLVEVTPASLPDGDITGQYRIRTFNGMVIHSLPDRDSLSIKNQKRGDHRAWIIEDLGNGFCTLFNVGKKKYLSTKMVSDVWEPVFADKPPLALTSTGSTAEEEKNNSPWRIEAMSEFTWSVYVTRGTDRFGFQGTDKLSLSLKDDTAILKPWKKAHNQIWMIEPTDAPLSLDNNKQPGNNEILQGAPFTSNSSYTFMSYDKSGGIRVAFNSAKRYEASFVIIPSTFTPSTLFMERNPSGQAGEIYIYRLLNAQKYYLTVSGTQVTVGTDQYSWTIEQVPDQAFYIIRDTQSKACLSPNQGSLSVKQSSANDTSTFWSIVS